jgi:flagellar motility protein MotE (MotC chaperone)
MEKGKEEVEEKKSRPFQKFLLMVFIPLLFAIIAALIIATASGVNVFAKAQSASQKIPVISRFFPKENTQSATSDGQNAAELKSQLKERDSEINKLQGDLNSKDNELQQAQLENSKLQQDISDLKTSQNQTKTDLKNIISTYETMDSQKAATIISNMSDTEALQILTSVKPEVLAGIMENMDATKAARFTELMTNTNQTGSTSTP